MKKAMRVLKISRDIFVTVAAIGVGVIVKHFVSMNMPSGKNALMRIAISVGGSVIGWVIARTIRNQLTETLDSILEEINDALSGALDIREHLVEEAA